MHTVCCSDYSSFLRYINVLKKYCYSLVNPSKAEGAEENLRSIVGKVVAFNKLFFHGKSNFLWSYHTEMRKCVFILKFLGLCLFCVLNIYLKYYYIELIHKTA